jgi:aminopeptidase N
MKWMFFLLLLTNTSLLYSQHFNRGDTLRGFLSEYRSCYDVKFYDLKVTIDDLEKSIEQSSNTIHFLALNDFSTFQIDLASNMQIIYIDFEGDSLEYVRDFNAVFIKFNRQIHKNENCKITIHYWGYPKEARNPPWDGGFSWKKDKNNNPWIGVSCQGIGASLWWPCKDHQSDKPDSMLITITARDPLKILSNGNLIEEKIIWSSYFNSWMNTSTWFVSYPINNYNVTLNIGDYVHFSDYYVSISDTLQLDYYVLSGNEEKAVKHFNQVKPMMNCFENYFGAYPFINDGYALIQTPYLGMEHQSAISYGNNFLPGYYGNKNFIDGLDFDFIIVHESGHEWWGNSVTTNDIADMWVHEGFCTYSEVLYVECMYGYEKMLSYVNNQKQNVRNDMPVLGHYNVNRHGSTDMYYKGSLMLHTLRTLVNNDSLWFEIIYDIANNFKYKAIDGNEIINYIKKKTGKELTAFFNQYLKQKELPVFNYSLEKNGRNTTLIFNWDAVEDFNMPLLINTGREDFWIYPSKDIKELDLGFFDNNTFRIRTDLMYIEVKNL